MKRMAEKSRALELIGSTINGARMRHKRRRRKRALMRLRKRKARTPGKCPLPLHETSHPIRHETSNERSKERGLAMIN